MNAYKLSNQLELAACVLTEGAAKELNARPCCKDLTGTFIVEYMIPMKESEQHMLTVMAHTYGCDSPAPDIHTTVLHAFWGNRKDISRSARSKASNTEQWLEFLLGKLKHKV